MNEGRDRAGQAWRPNARIAADLMVNTGLGGSIP